MTPPEIVSKLWALCNVLRDDGIVYHQYVTELTYLLFLKLAKETGSEEQIPAEHRWDSMRSHRGAALLEQYKIALIRLGRSGSSRLDAIFENAGSSIKKPSTIEIVFEELDGIDWYRSDRDQLGDIYEGLLARNAEEKRAGAGQYFTPRVLIDVIVALVRPTSTDTIQDPAAGTGGFLVGAHQYIQAHERTATWSKKKRCRYATETFSGMEHVEDTHRMAAMNLLLHGIECTESSGVRYGDTLSIDGVRLPTASVILTNPPFGNRRGGGGPSRTDLKFPTSNKALSFLQHVYGALKEGGRAAMILPDNALFENHSGRQVRAELMDRCDLHTILR
jgi:type I restriction enzyme M protein